MTTDPLVRAPGPDLDSGTWWTVLLRSALAVVLGLLLFIVPVERTVIAFVVLFGAAALVWGGFDLFTGIRRRGSHGATWLVIEGVLSLVGGVIALVWPGPTAVVLLVLIAIWAIVTGATQCATAFALRRAGVGHWYWLLVAGALAVVMGVIMIARPGVGAIAIVGLIAGFLIASGVAGLVFAFASRSSVSASARSDADTV